LRRTWYAALVALACSSPETAPPPQPPLTSGVRIVYLVEPGSHDAPERTVRAMRTRLERLGVAPSRVVGAEERRVAVEIPPLSDERVDHVREVLARRAALEVAVEGSAPFLRPGEVANAAVRTDPNTGEAFVRVELGPAAARRFAEVTGKNIGRKLVISIDGAVVSTPIVAARVAGGFFDVPPQGPFDDVAVLAAALPAPLPSRVLVESMSRIGEP